MSLLLNSEPIPFSTVNLMAAKPLRTCVSWTLSLLLHLWQWLKSIFFITCFKCTVFLMLAYTTAIVTRALIIKVEFFWTNLGINLLYRRHDGTTARVQASSWHQVHGSPTGGSSQPGQEQRRRQQQQEEEEAGWQDLASEGSRASPGVPGLHGSLGLRAKAGLDHHEEASGYSG